MPTTKQQAKAITHDSQLGASFSIRACEGLGIDWQDCLNAAVNELKIKRFRLGSYWDLHEQQRGKIDFSLLDKQLETISKSGGKVTMALGIRQPRWPESHRPEWASQLHGKKLESTFIKFFTESIKHLRQYECIESWQLENEFWNRGFGNAHDFSRKRFKKEFKILRKLDDRPIIMSLANTYGYPMLGPRPDLYGTTVYLTQYNNAKYQKTLPNSSYYRFRAAMVKLFTGRPLIIHELQAEPWGPTAVQMLSASEVNKSMSLNKLKQSIKFARLTGMQYADLWGLEWWYYMKSARNDDSYWKYIQSVVQKQQK